MMEELKDKILQVKEDFDEVYEAGILEGNQIAYNKPYIDTSQITDFSYLYQDGKRLNVLPPHLLDTSNGTTFSGMFISCRSLTEIPELDTSSGEIFSYMFSTCSSLTNIPALDTSNGTIFSSMFINCSSLTEIPALDTSNGTNLSAMFYGCSSLTNIPALDTSNSSTCYGIFYNCSSLTTIPQLDTSNSTDFRDMFYNCSSLTTIPQLDLSKSNSISNMFYKCSALTDITIIGSINYNFDIRYSPLTHDSLMSIIDALKNNPSVTYTLTIGSDNIAKLSEEEQQIVADKGWKLA